MAGIGAVTRERGELDGQVERAVPAQQVRPPVGHGSRLGGEGRGELPLEPQPRVTGHRLVEQDRRHLPGPHPHHVEGRTSREQVGDRAVNLEGDIRAVVQRDRAAHHLGGGSREPHLLGDPQGVGRTGRGEVDTGDRVLQPGVVQQRRGEQHLAIHLDPLKAPDRHPEDVGPVRVV